MAQKLTHLSCGLDVGRLVEGRLRWRGREGDAESDAEPLVPWLQLELRGAF